MINLQVIIASVRPGRAGLPIGQWFNTFAKADGRFEVDLVDLIKLDLPFMDEPNHPRLGQYTQDHTKAWSERVNAADAFVFVMPEYNYSAPPALLNAISFLHKEWNHKVVGFVSYGGASAGTRSVEAIKGPVSALGMTALGGAVNVPFFTQFIDDEGEFIPNEPTEKGASAMLDQLAKWEGALSSIR